MRFLSVLCLLSITTGIGVSADEPIKLRLGSAFDSATANAAVIARIEKDPDNHKLQVACMSEDFFRSSEKDLDGENTPSEIRFEFKLDRGKYECTGTLTRQGQKDLVATTGFYIR